MPCFPPALAIVALACACSGVGNAQPLRDDGEKATDPWISVCDRRSCVTADRAASTFLDLVYQLHGSPVFADNPFFLTVKDWASLVALATAKHEAVVAQQQTVTAELCARPENIHAQSPLSTTLSENVNSTRRLDEAYNGKLKSLELTPAGREVVNARIDYLWDFVLTVDLEYASYFAAMAIEPAVYFESACSSPPAGRQTGRRAKPRVLPLVVFVGPECPVSAELVRRSAEAAISREDIEPLRWPALQEGRAWFGAYVGLECDDVGRRPFLLRLSLIDSIDGSLVLYDASVDGAEYYGLGPPHHSPYSYQSFAGDAVDQSVGSFLRGRFELP